MVFLFKKKTAYEMRISDWSSDVCSSDLTGHAGQALKDLREHGFRIALDDFGTGYSSLSYLRRFQFDRLKIDRSFIEGVEENSDAVAVIEAVVTLGRRLGLEIVAEGIENEAQAKLMKEVGCTPLQGWFEIGR